jgi:cytochrome c oxidase subunit 2
MDVSGARIESGSEHGHSTRAGAWYATRSSAASGSWGLGSGFDVSGATFAAREWNLQPPVTPVARMFDLHSFIFWACAIHRRVRRDVLDLQASKSVGHKAHQFHENATVEVIWTVIPFLILLHGVPATKTVLAMKDSSGPV